LTEARSGQSIRLLLSRSRSSYFVGRGHAYLMSLAARSASVKSLGLASQALSRLERFQRFHIVRIRAEVKWKGPEGNLKVFFA